jgi:NADH:ubiquinone reductase (H+-translocating)
VVIIGSGFGGLFAAKHLRRANVDVTLISETPYHLFQPLLYQVATGILSEGLISPATRGVAKRYRNTEILLGHVEHIDVDRREVISVTEGYRTTTPYDSIIVAAGAQQSYFGHDEFAEYAPGLKTIPDALDLRHRIFGSFERAEAGEPDEDASPWMTFVVVGAGATGVEVAGQISELSRRALRGNFRRINPADARVILVDGADAVLGSFGDKQSAYAQSALERMGIEVRLGAMVSHVDAEGIELSHADASVERIDSRCKVWAAGVTASPLAASLAEQTGAEVDRAGRIACKPDLTLPGHPEVFVVGDMVSLNNYPGVAQVAMQGGKYAAKRIRARVSGKETPTTDVAPFSYFDKGSMATISRFRAVANVGRLQVRGFLAWLLWLFIHLMFLIGFHQQVTTLGHWLVAFIGRTRTERSFTPTDISGDPAHQDLPPPVKSSTRTDPVAHLSETASQTSSGS